jgi:putative membrane protein
MKFHFDQESGQPADPPRTYKLRDIFRSRAAYLGLTAGIVVFVAVIATQGIVDVAQALGRAGWGIIAIAVLHLPPLWADSMGWRSLISRGDRPKRRTMIRARWIGESINDLLPVLQMGGNVVKARILAARGIRVGLAGASVVVDVTLVVLAQILFTLLGLGLLVPVIGGGKALPVILVGTAILTILLAGFYAAQRRGLFGFVARLSRRIVGTSEWTSVSNSASTIDAGILRLYGKRLALVACMCWHMLGWFLGIAEVWFGLSLLGHPVDIRTALLFESLGQAIRTGAFAVPGALGIQEGGYVLVGSALGIEPSVALALSLARRARELLLGLPGLAVWQSSVLCKVFRRAPDSTLTPP